jgi:hypothetical protein
VWRGVVGRGEANDLNIVEEKRHTHRRSE